MDHVAKTRKMNQNRYFLAIDIGASSGRHILGYIKDKKLQLEEIYRFKNGVYNNNNQLCWNLDSLFKEILNGLKKLLNSILEYLKKMT